MSLEPRTIPAEAASPTLAVQNGPQPTRKVAAAANAAGSLAAVIGGVMAGYGGPAIMELLGEYGKTHPSIAGFLVMMATSVASFLAVKYGGQAAAYNVLDKPNVPMVPAKGSIQ